MHIVEALLHKAFRSGLFKVQPLPDNHGYTLQVRIFGMWIGLVHMSAQELANERV